jgi:DNA-binding CsgD family transcriptional regulator
MLFGRSRECEQLDRLIDHSRAGKSGAVLLRGEAGIGKSALCAYATERAGDMTVLAARGAPTESELAFSGLADVLRPVLSLRGELPEPQAAALGSALAIDEPLDAGHFTIYAATLGLLAAAAANAPVLVVVDEAQWLDASSLEALLFATRRFDADGVAVIFAVRDGPPTLFDRAELPELLLAPLDHEAALELLRSCAKTPVAPEVAEALLRAAGGNPLVLTELPSLLSPDQLSGGVALDDELPSPLTVQRAFLRQVASLPKDTQKALLVVAASGSRDLEVILRALEALGIDPHSLEPAERAAVVSARDGGLEFRHPLFRSAVYEAASELARRETHHALAGSGVPTQEVERRAWHLAAAAPASDAAAAKALDTAALAARGRGGHAEASSAFERAAELGSEGAERARRLREAAADAWLVGRADHARNLLATALDTTDEPRLRARIQHRLAAIEIWHGSPIAAYSLLVEEASKVEELDPARAARMLTDAAWASFMAAEVSSGLALAERACELGARTGGIAETLAKAVLGIALTLEGETERAIAMFGDYLTLVESTESAPASGLYQPLRPDGQLLMWFEHYDHAREVLTRTIDGARAGGALAALPYALSVSADLDFRTGNWASAYASATEAVRVAHETHQVATLAFSLGCLARLEAAQGREEDCRSHSEQAHAIAASGVGAVTALASSSLGMLELGAGRLEQALEELEPLARRTADHGLREPGVIPWTPDLIETYVRLGHKDDAERTLADFERIARKTNRLWALAAAARCRGLIAADDAFEAEFQRAFKLHEKTPTPFERARTNLCYGERLRRAGRRSDARDPLRSAVEAFERLGAAPWGDRARAELAATGTTARPRDPYAPDRLTPQELQVAVLVARGATNKEAGAALFLSPKTIETHLGRVYRKLGVRSRTELAHLLGTQEDLTAATGLAPSLS